jgi:hypothetical protein
VRAAQRLARVDAQLGRQPPPGGVVDGERLCLPAGAGQRTHQLAGAPLVERMAASARGHLGQQLGVPAAVEREVGVVEGGGVPLAVQLGPPVVDPGGVHRTERLAAPQPQCLREEGFRLVGRPRRGGAGARGERAEPVQVDGLRVDR